MIRVLTYILGILDLCPEMNQPEDSPKISETKGVVKTEPKSVRVKVAWFLGDDTKPLDGKQN
jgi:hypothetical protein